MTADACREWRGALAAAALEREDPAQQIALRAHLDGCAACRAELDDLVAVARALPAADPDRLADTAQPSSRLAGQVVERVAEVRTRRRRRRIGRALAAAAVIAALLGFGGLLVANLGDDAETTTVEFPASDGVTARADLHGAVHGTEVRLEASGLEADEVYWLWLTDEGGERVAAGTFRGSDDEVAVTLTGALPLADTVRIWVTDEADSVVLDSPVRS
ncbi:MAG: zf-HC2 domain-containing protein [Acidimicrobiia bacterium]